MGSSPIPGTSSFHFRTSLRAVFSDIPRAAAVVDIAKVFEKYLTEEPIKSYEIRLEDDDDDASGGDKPGAKRAPSSFR